MIAATRPAAPVRHEIDAPHQTWFGTQNRDLHHATLNELLKLPLWLDVSPEYMTYQLWFVLKNVDWAMRSTFRMPLLPTKFGAEMTIDPFGTLHVRVTTHKGITASDLDQFVFRMLRDSWLWINQLNPHDPDTQQNTFFVEWQTTITAARASRGEDWTRGAEVTLSNLRHDIAAVATHRFFCGHCDNLDFSESGQLDRRRLETEADALMQRVQSAVRTARN